MQPEVFQQLGLEDREIKIYLELLKLGQSKAGKLSQRIKIDRSVVYKLLYKLIEKGFVSSVIRENRKYFQATDPEKLLDVLKEREERLHEIIPELHSLKKPIIETQVEVYKGKEGFKTVMNDLLKKKTDLYGIGYTAKGPEIAKYWYEQWNNQRIKEKIHSISEKDLLLKNYSIKLIYLTYLLDRYAKSKGNRKINTYPEGD